MRKLLCVVVVVLSVNALVHAASIPQQITYQGTLKKSSVPVNGTRKMRFKLTDANGAVTYWASPTLIVPITLGLFSQVLEPSGVDWQQVSPYIEVTISEDETHEPNILLLPREPVTANVYSLISGGVVDNSISKASLKSDVKDDLIPVGIIALFKTDCPSGWQRVAELDGRYPKGGARFGETGGSNTHQHVISMDGDHQHMTPIIGKQNFNSVPLVPPFGTRQFNTTQTVFGLGQSFPSAQIDLAQLTSSDGRHNHGGLTMEASSEPPYLEFLFCEKR